MPDGMLVSAGSWDRSQRTRTPSKRAYGYDPKELLASKPSSGTRQASAGSSECADAAQSASAGRGGAAAAGQAMQATAPQGAELHGRTPQQQQQQRQQPSLHAAAPPVPDGGLSAQQPFQQAPDMPPLPKLAIWQLEPPAQPARPPGGMRSVWQVPQATRKPRTGVRTLEVPVHVGFSIQGLSAALHRTKDGGGSAAGRSSDASTSEDDLPAILQTGSRYPQPSRQQSIHKKGQVCALQKGHNCATLMSTPCMTWWPAPGAANGVMCSDCRTKFGHHCPHDPKCEPCFLRLSGAKPAPRGAVPRQRAGAQPAAVPAGPELATAPPISRLIRGLKQLAAQKPPTKESTQVKELVAAYEAELAVTHRSNTLPAGANWRASRPLLPPNFAPKPPRHAPLTAATAAARAGSATQPLCRPLQLQGTALQQAAADLPKPAAPSSNAGLAGATGAAVCHACAQPAAPAGQSPAWQSMAAKSQQPAQAGPAATAALPPVAASAGEQSAQAKTDSPVRQTDSSSGRRAPAPLQPAVRQQQRAAQLAGERAAGQPNAAAAGAEAPQQPAAAGGQAAATAGILHNAPVGGPSSSTYKSFPGVCQRISQKQAAVHQPADADPDIQALVTAKALADGDIVQYRVSHGQGVGSASPAAVAGTEAAASGSLGSSSAGGGTPSARSSGHDPVLASAVVDAAAGGLRCRRCRAVVTPAQLQRGCAGTMDDVSPLARIFTRGKRSVRRSLLELLAGLRSNEPSCASAPAASVGKKRYKVVQQAQPSSGVGPTEVATLATQQPCATVEASGAASGGAGGSSNGSGSVAGAPPPGTPDTVSPSRPPGSAGARGRRKRSSTDPSGPDAAAPPANASGPSPLPQPGRLPEKSVTAAKRRRRSGTASASEIETLVVDLSSSSGEASAPAASAALPKSSGGSGPGQRKRSAAIGSPVSTETPPADNTPLAPGAQAAMAAWRAQQKAQQAAARQPDARRTRSSSSGEAASGSPAQGSPLAPAARAAAEAVRRQQAAARAWAQQELAADEAGLGTRSNPVSVASGPVEPLSSGSKRSSRHRRCAAADPICLLSSSEESGDGASDGGGRDAGGHGAATGSPRRTRASKQSASGSKGGGGKTRSGAERQQAAGGARSSSSSKGGGASGAAKLPSVTRAAASVAASFATGAKADGNASASREGRSAGTSGAATDAEGERPKKAPRRKETEGSLKRRVAPTQQPALHQSKRHRMAIAA